jgi:DNA-binding response OmpR family regulator
MPRQNSIIVIGDDSSLRHTLALILGHAGYTVTVAAGAHQGLRELVHMHWDLVFVDVRLPDIEGPLLLPQLRQYQPHVPIIMLAPQVTPELALELWRNGVSALLTKPVEPVCILAQVQALVIEKLAHPSKTNSHARTPAPGPWSNRERPR